MSEKEFEIILPEEKFYTMTAEEDGKPAVICVNGGLCGFEPKIVFGWHLSIQFTLQGTDNGLPSKDELDLLYTFEDGLNNALKDSEEKPNALFLGTCNWNDRREIMFRVNNPEIADGILSKICERNETPRAFHYEMDHDPEWLMTEYYLDPIKTK